MSTQNVLISTENLLDLLTNQKVDKKIIANTNNLLNAISDFPTEVDDPTDYINLLKEEIGDVLTYNETN